MLNLADKIILTITHMFKEFKENMLSVSEHRRNLKRKMETKKKGDCKLEKYNH